MSNEFYNPFIMKLIWKIDEETILTQPLIKRESCETKLDNVFRT